MIKSVETYGVPSSGVNYLPPVEKTDVAECRKCEPSITTRECLTIDSCLNNNTWNSNYKIVRTRNRSEIISQTFLKLILLHRATVRATPSPKNSTTSIKIARQCTTHCRRASIHHGKSSMTQTTNSERLQVQPYS